MSKELRAKKRSIRRELEAQEKIRSTMDGFCMRSIKSQAGGSCVNQSRKSEDEKGCDYCFQHSNYEDC